MFPYFLSDLSIEEYGRNNEHTFSYLHIFKHLENVTNVFFISKTYGFIPPYFLDEKRVRFFPYQLICRLLYKKIGHHVDKKLNYFWTKSTKEENVIKKNLFIFQFL